MSYFSTLRHRLWPDVVPFYVVARYRPHLANKEEVLHRLFVALLILKVYFEMKKKIMFIPKRSDHLLVLLPNVLAYLL